MNRITSSRWAYGGPEAHYGVFTDQMVVKKKYLTEEELVELIALTTILPGPMFSFSAYAGGMAARGDGPLIQMLGAMVSGIGIFMPGLLLIYFVYPIWERLKKVRGIKVSLKGITAVAGGLIAVASIILMQKSGFVLDNILITFLTVIILLTKRMPAPLIVLGTLMIGFIF